MHKSLVEHNQNNSYRNAYPALEAQCSQDGSTADRRPGLHPEAEKPLPKSPDANGDKKRRPEAAREL